MHWAVCMNGRRSTAREPGLDRPDVQETGETLDPQRQHAQLLGLWSQGSKLVRRLEYRGYRDRLELNRAERWWNLARALSERGLVVQLLPLSPPVALVAFDSGKTGWVTLVDEAGAEVSDPALYHRRLIVQAEDAPALMLGVGGPRLSELLLRRLSAKTLGTLMMLAEDCECRLAVGSVPDALVLLAAWRSAPEQMSRVEPGHWAAVAKLWRHRGQAIASATDFSTRYPFIIREADGRQRWQDSNPG